MGDIAELEIIDRSIVRELMGVIADSDNKFMIELIEGFVRDARAALGRMGSNVLANDAASLAREAHRLKGSSATVGAVRLAGECLLIERAARDGRCAGLERHVERASQLLEATRRGLGEFFRGTITTA
jgi:HPt (histidine-containing phosphotransfer) domain-containing protein